MFKKIISLCLFTSFSFVTAHAEDFEFASTSWQLMSLAEIKAKQDIGDELVISTKDAVDYAKFFSPVGEVDFTQEGLNEIKLAQKKDEIVAALTDRVDNFSALNSLVVFFSDSPKSYHDYDLDHEAFALEPMRKNTAIQAKNHDIIDREKREEKYGLFKGKISGIIVNNEFVDYLPVDLEKASKVIDEANIRYVNMQYILYPVDFDGEMVHYEIVGYRATGRDSGLFQDKVIGAKLNQQRLIELGIESLELDRLIESQAKI